MGGIALAPRLAGACDYAPGVWGSVPEDGQKLPANAAVFLRGADLSLGDGQAMVDGVPATLEVVDELTAPGTFGDLAVRVVPEPKPGQRVEIFGTFCPDGWDCAQVTYTFDVVEADDDAPAAVTDLGFDVFEHGQEFGDDCGGYAGDVSYYLRFGDDSQGQEPLRLLHEIRVHRGENPDVDPVRRLVIYDDDLDEDPIMVRVLLERAMDLEGEDAPDAFCFSVHTRDASNNVVAEVPIACLPCHHRVDPNVNFGYEPPPWTDDDIYPAGVCAEDGGATGGGTEGGTEDGGGGDAGDDGGADDGGSGTGGGQADDGTRGCACGFGGAPTACLPLAMMLLLRRRD